MSRLTKDEAVAKTQNQLNFYDNRQIEGFINQIQSRTVQNIRENINATVEETTSAPVQRLVNDIGERLVDVSTSWVSEQSKKLIVFPQGTRFVQRDDRCTNIIVEQPPTCRRILFNNRYNGLGNMTAFVSLPYVYFIITFSKHGRGEKFKMLKVVASKTPIESLTDMVYDLPLPNLNYGVRFGVCTGGATSGMELPEGSDAFTDKCNTLITSFWNSEFNTDLSQNMISFFQKNFGYDQLTTEAGHRFKTCFERWEQASRANPMWALGADVKWPQEVGSQIGRLVESDLASRSNKAATTRQLKQIVTNGLFELATSATSAIRSTPIDETTSVEASKAGLRTLVKEGLNNAYSHLGELLHSDIEEEKRRTLAALETDKRKLEEDQKKFAAEKLKTQIELAAVHQHLEAEKAKLNAIQTQNFETVVAGLKAEIAALKAAAASAPVAGPVIVKRGRGRPRKERPPLPLGPDGQPIKRGRGRPRKTPLPAGGVSQLGSLLRRSV